MLSLLIVLSSCSNLRFNDKELQKNELKGRIDVIVNSRLSESDLHDFNITNCNNPYEAAGIITTQVTKKFFKEIQFKKSETDSIISEFGKVLRTELPASLLSTDTTNFDKLEETIENALSNIYINEGYDNFVIKSKRIEELINGSSYFNDDQKKRILVFSSVMRQEIGLFLDYFSDSKEVSPWGDCMKAKLKELQDCKNCFIEKIKCALFWPECLAIKALDCLISVIF